MLLLASVSVFAQGTITGSLTGNVTSDNAPLPGATVTVTSPQLQGSRTAITDANGNYNIAGLPPGDYTVRIELQGLQTVTRSTRVTLAGTARVDADLRVSAVTESITVTASAPAVLETTEVQSNFQKEQVDNLPMARTVTAVALLAPGVTNNGPNGVQISGAMSTDNLILVNGANVQENLRGQARPLFIEDAIQETTVMTAGVSAEFGRFTGGVVNAITKSGGNEFSGSIRDNLDNPAWTEVSAAGESEPSSTLNQTYEATLGGRIIRDRLWFFTAGRYGETTNLARFSSLRQANPNQPQIFSTTENLRYEIKLTGQITPNHTLVGDYLKNNVESTNDVQLGSPWELEAVDPSIEPLEDFKAAHYSGIFTNNLLGEINYSERNYTFVGFGGENTDLFAGTPLVAYFGGQYGVANAPYFCGTCGDELRNNDYITAKLTYFLGTRGLGTHNLVAGVEDYSEMRLSNNFQSPTNLTVWMYATAPVRNPDGSVTYTVTPGSDTIEYFPVEHPSLGSDLQTRSLFVNDKWDLNANFSFNLGLRYDQTQSVDSFGNETSDETSFSPRLAATFDPAGNGRMRFTGTYGRYVGRLAETVQGLGSGAGEPSFYLWYYGGPEIVTNSSREAVTRVLQWFQANGGTNLVNHPPDYSSVGGVNTRLAGSLKAPGMDEWTVGAGFQLSPNAYVRADFVNREWNNYYAQFTNLQTGQIEDPNGFPTDLTLVTNSDLFVREYQGVQVQGQYRAFNRLNIGGNYTWSTLEGNAEGEGSGGGPQAEGGWVLQYPEYQGFQQNRPFGYLSGDQRHKARLWAAMDFPLGPIGTFNLSVMQRYDSGTPYSATFTVQAAAAPDAPAGIANYTNAPANVTYFIGERGAFRWDDVHRTDVGLNYRLPLFGAEFFAEAEVFNVFNRQSQIGGATTVVGPTSSRTACGNGTVRCTKFNPFTTTPQEGVHYQRLTQELATKLAPSGSLNNSVFGRGSQATHFQLARTYQFSLGFRF
jgi:hypothetical protein